MKTNLFLTAALSLSLCAASTAQTLPAYLPTDGLVGWWPFNGNANDESGNGNNGTVNGATLTIDRFGNANNAYSFNGFSNHITVLDNDNLDLVNNFTISCWFKASELNEVNMIISKHDAILGDNFGTYTMGLWMVNQNSVINCQASPNLNNQTFPPANVGGVQIEEWRNFLVTYSDSLDVLKYYLDGILVHTINIVFNVQNTELPFRIGANMNNGLLYNFFAGSLDDIGVWNRVLSTQEIATIYSDEPVNPPTACNPLPANLQNGLVGYWPFCGNANDESGNGNDGTVNGATLTEDRFGVANTSFNFDGISNYIELPLLSEINNLSQLSFSMWVRSDFEFNELYRTAFAHWITSGVGSGAVGLQVAFGGQGTVNQGGVSSALMAGIGSWSADNLITPNTWTQVLIVFDGTQSNPTQRFQLYLNGQFSGYYGDSSIPESIGNTAEKTVIGASVGPGGFNNTYNYFNGSLDDIGIWNRALSPEEVQQLYTLNACTFTVYDTVIVENVVTVYDTVLTTVTDTLIINTLITALAPPANTNTIKVFPNPAGSILTIDYGNFALMNGYQLRIENSLGQDVFQTNISQQSDTLSLGTWGGNGLYFVHIVDPQGNTVDIRKIVLQ